MHEIVERSGIKTSSDPISEIQGKFCIGDMRCIQLSLSLKFKKLTFLETRRQFVQIYWLLRAKENFFNVLFCLHIQ